MAMISDKDKKAVGDRLAKLTGPVKVTLFIGIGVLLYRAEKDLDAVIVGLDPLPILGFLFKFP